MRACVCVCACVCGPTDRRHHRRPSALPAARPTAPSPPPPRRLALPPPFPPPSCPVGSPRIASQFNTGVILGGGFLELRPRYILLHYLKTTFVLDLLGVLQLELAGGAHAHDLVAVAPPAHGSPDGTPSASFTSSEHRDRHLCLRLQVYDVGDHSYSSYSSYSSYRDRHLSVFGIHWAAATELAAPRGRTFTRSAHH